MSNNLKLGEEVLLAAKNGGQNAFEKIVYGYERPIYGYIYRIVNNRTDAEDLTQETFLKLYRNMGRRGRFLYTLKIRRNIFY